MREETSPPREPSPPLCISIITSPPPSSPVNATCRRSPTSPSARHAGMTLSPTLSPGSSSRCSPTTLQASYAPAYHTGGGGSPTNQKAAVSATVQHQQDNLKNPSNKFTSNNNNKPDNFNNDTATVRTQDLLNSFACKKLNGGPTTQSVEISISDVSARCAGEVNQVTNDQCAVTNKISVSDPKDTNNSSPTQTSANQKTCVKIIDSNYRTKTEQNNYICDCFNQICTKCSKNSERNINNNLRDNINNNNNNVIVSTTHSSNTLTVSRANTRHKLRHQSSSQGSFDGSSSTSPCLSRGTHIITLSPSLFIFYQLLYKKKVCIL